MGSVRYQGQTRVRDVNFRSAPESLSSAPHNSCISRLVLRGLGVEEDDAVGGNYGEIRLGVFGALTVLLVTSLFFDHGPDMIGGQRPARMEDG